MDDRGVFLGEADASIAVANQSAILARRLRAEHAGALAFIGTDPLALLTAASAAFEVGVPLAVAGRYPGEVTAHVTHVYGDRNELSRSSTSREASKSELRDVAIVCPTSGSFGRPHLVPWTQRGVAYQVDATATRLGYKPTDRVAVLTPLSSAYGLSLVAMWLYGRLDIALPTVLRPDAVCMAAQRLGVIGIEASPVWWDLVHRMARWDQVPSSAQILACGGDTLPVPLARACLASTDRPLLDGYGLTEAGPNVALSGPGSWRLGTVGRPLSGTEVAVDATGVLRVRGPGIAQGYLSTADAERATDTENGPRWDGEWLVTGDLADVDVDGFLAITGRASTRLKVRGEIVHPEQVERCLRQAEAVVDVAVISWPVKSTDELVALLVADDPDSAESQCRTLARDLTLPSRPRRYRFVAALPRNANGKLDRSALRTLAESKRDDRL